MSIQAERNLLFPQNVGCSQCSNNIRTKWGFSKNQLSITMPYFFFLQRSNMVHSHHKPFKSTRFKFHDLDKGWKGINGQIWWELLWVAGGQSSVRGGNTWDHQLNCLIKTRLETRGKVYLCLTVLKTLVNSHLLLLP